MPQITHGHYNLDGSGSGSGSDNTGERNMNIRKTRWLLTLSAAFLVLTTGCATTSPPAASGFLTTYEGLEVDPADESLLWWEQEGFNWSNYNSVLIDPVAIYFHPEAQGREILPDELKKLTDAFREAVFEELGDAYPVVETPAADVLRIRCAITDIIPSNAALNVATSLVAFVPFDMGGAAIEVEFLDSVTGERLAVGVDQKLGTPFDGIKGLTRLGHAIGAFRDWAKELRVALDTNP